MIYSIFVSRIGKVLRGVSH